MINAEEASAARDYMSAIEAILFAGGDPIPLGRLAAVLNVAPADAKSYAEALAGEYETQQRGIRVARLGGSYQMCTCERYAEYVKKALEIRRSATLSQAATEVLAVVAYNQPVTKAFIEQVRGVDCSGVINNLMEKELIEEAGRLELPGRPIAYRTGYNFLRCFSLSSIDELPPVESAEDRSEDDEERDDGLFGLVEREDAAPEGGGT